MRMDKSKEQTLTFICMYLNTHPRTRKHTRMQHADTYYAHIHIIYYYHYYSFIKVQDR